MYLIRKKKKDKTPIEDYDWYEENGEIAYWRKANQIHKFFVDTIQNGVDDCGIYKVEKEDIKRLVDICNDILRQVELIDGKVLLRDYYTGEEHIKEYGIGKIIDKPDICKELLPSQEGFFFGSYEYDEWYYRDIEYTRNRLQAILDLLEWNLYDIYYHSSW